MRGHAPRLFNESNIPYFDVEAEQHYIVLADTQTTTHHHHPAATQQQSSRRNKLADDRQVGREYKESSRLSLANNQGCRSYFNKKYVLPSLREFSYTIKVTENYK